MAAANITKRFENPYGPVSGKPQSYMGNGTPALTDFLTDDTSAPVGSEYVDLDTGILYIKNDTGDSWVAQ
jgi:hypothetical protein